MRIDIHLNQHFKFHLSEKLSSPTILNTIKKHLSNQSKFHLTHRYAKKYSIKYLYFSFQTLLTKNRTRIE